MNSTFGAPFAPLNRNAMFTDYVDPTERAVACPNQDVVWSCVDSARSIPVVVQVPESYVRAYCPSTAVIAPGHPTCAKVN